MRPGGGGAPSVTEAPTCAFLHLLWGLSPDHSYTHSHRPGAKGNSLNWAGGGVGRSKFAVIRWGLPARRGRSLQIRPQFSQRIWKVAVCDISALHWLYLSPLGGGAGTGCESCLMAKDPGTFPTPGSRDRPSQLQSRPSASFVTSPQLASGILPWRGTENQLRLKRKCIGSSGTWKGVGRSVCSQLARSRPFSFLLFVGWGHFSLTTDGLIHETGILAVGSCGYRNPALWPKGERKLPHYSLHTNLGKC